MKYKAGVVCIDDMGRVCLVQKASTYTFINVITGSHRHSDLHNLTRDEKERILSADRVSDVYREHFGDLAYRSETRIASIDAVYNEKYKSILPRIDVYGVLPWDIPKGKQEYRESRFDCACREFYEETRLLEADIHRDIVTTVRDHDCIMTFYLATFHGSVGDIDIGDKEIRCCKWFDICNMPVYGIKKKIIFDIIGLGISARL